MVPLGATGTDCHGLSRFCHGLSRFVTGNHFLNKNDFVVLAGRMVGAVSPEILYWVSNPVRTRASPAGFRNRNPRARAPG